MLAIVFVVPWLLYVNTVKNVADWTAAHGDYRSLPQVMQAPLFDSISLSAWGWFNLCFGIASAAFILLLWAHSRRPLAIVPENWIGRGQMLYFVIVWSFVLANFAKALTGFTDQRPADRGSDHR